MMNRIAIAMRAMLKNAPKATPTIPPVDSDEPDAAAPAAAAVVEGKALVDCPRPGSERPAPSVKTLVSVSTTTVGVPPGPVVVLEMTANIVVRPPTLVAVGATEDVAVSVPVFEEVLAGAELLELPPSTFSIVHR